MRLNSVYTWLFGVVKALVLWSFLGFIFANVAVFLFKKFSTNAKM